MNTRHLTKGEVVQVDCHAFQAHVTPGHDYVECTVMEDTPATKEKVFVSKILDYETTFVYRNLIQP